MARNGRIPASKAGRDWRFDAAELQKLKEKKADGCVGRVLIVDDDWRIRDLVDRVLRSADFEVSSAANGEEGLRLLDRVAPDVVILDLVMPGLDGVEVLKRIRQRQDFVPVIIMTGFTDSDRMKDALEYSPVTVLAKPAMPQTLISAVKEQCPG